MGSSIFSGHVASPRSSRLFRIRRTARDVDFCQLIANVESAFLPRFQIRTSKVLVPSVQMRESIFLHTPLRATASLQGKVQQPARSAPSMSSSPRQPPLRQAQDDRSAEPRAKRKIPRQATSLVAYAPAPEPEDDDPLLAFAPYLHPSPRGNSITPDKQRKFIATLAASGIVSQAARAIGKSMEALYQLRHRPGAEGFPRRGMRRWSAG